MCDRKNFPVALPDCNHVVIPELLLCPQGERGLLQTGPRLRCACAEATSGGGTEREEDCACGGWSPALPGCHRLWTGEVQWPVVRAL